MELSAQADVQANHYQMCPALTYQHEAQSGNHDRDSGNYLLESLEESAMELLGLTIGETDATVLLLLQASQSIADYLLLVKAHPVSMMSKKLHWRGRCWSIPIALHDAN